MAKSCGVNTFLRVEGASVKEVLRNWVSGCHGMQARMVGFGKALIGLGYE